MLVLVCVIARFTANSTFGHSRFGMSGQGSQFISSAKLRIQRSNTLVETFLAPALTTTITEHRSW
jgi:hypothetical protein